MRVPIGDLGGAGIVKDIPYHLIPPNAWTDVRGVRFYDNAVRKAEGYKDVIASSGNPLALFLAPYLTNEYIVYTTKSKAKAFLGASSGDITRVAGDYTGTDFDLWNGGMFNGILVVNNGVDVPQVWLNPALNQPMVNLPNWPSTLRAKVVKPFKEYLVALDCTKSGARDRRMVKWSHYADPGSLPASWDATNPAVDAGEVSLAEGEEALVDCEVLGDVNVLYTENSVWLQSVANSSDIFNFRKRFHNVGLLSQDCAKTFGFQQFAVSQDDIVVHNGTSIQSVVDGTLRRWFFKNLNSSVYQITKVVRHSLNKEMWILFPYGGGGVLNMALIFNWLTGQWSTREIPDSRAAVGTRVLPAGSADLFDSASGTIDSETGPIDLLTGFSTFKSVMIGGSDKIRLVDKTFGNNGSATSSYVEKLGLCVKGAGDKGPSADPRTFAIFQEMWPVIYALPGTRFTFYFGVRESPNADVYYQLAQEYVVGQTDKLSIYLTGRFLDFKIVEQGTNAWAMPEYELELEPLSTVNA